MCQVILAQQNRDTLGGQPISRPVRTRSLSDHDLEPNGRVNPGEPRGYECIHIPFDGGGNRHGVWFFRSAQHWPRYTEPLNQLFGIRNEI